MQSKIETPPYSIIIDPAILYCWHRQLIYDMTHIYARCRKVIEMCGVPNTYPCWSSPGPCWWVVGRRPGTSPGASPPPWPTRTPSRGARWRWPCVGSPKRVPSHPAPGSTWKWPRMRLACRRLSKIRQGVVRQGEGWRERE